MHHGRGISLITEAKLWHCFVENSRCSQPCYGLLTALRTGKCVVIWHRNTRKILQFLIYSSFSSFSFVSHPYGWQRIVCTTDPKAWQKYKVLMIPAISGQGQVIQSLQPCPGCRQSHQHITKPSMVRRREFPDSITFQSWNSLLLCLYRQLWCLNWALNKSTEWKPLGPDFFFYR